VPPTVFRCALSVLPPYSTICPIIPTLWTLSTLRTVAGGFIWVNDGDADDDNIGVAFDISSFSFIVVIVGGDEGWRTLFLSWVTILFRYLLLLLDCSRRQDIDKLVRALLVPPDR